MKHMVLDAFLGVLFWEGLGAFIILLPGIIICWMLGLHISAAVLSGVWFLALVSDTWDTYKFLEACERENGRKVLEEAA